MITNGGQDGTISGTLRANILMILYMKRYVHFMLKVSSKDVKCVTHAPLPYVYVIYMYVCFCHIKPVNVQLMLLL